MLLLIVIGFCLLFDSVVYCMVCGVGCLSLVVVIWYWMWVVVCLPFDIGRCVLFLVSCFLLVDDCFLVLCGFMSLWFYGGC